MSEVVGQVNWYQEAVKAGIFEEAAKMSISQQDVSARCRDEYRTHPGQWMKNVKAWLKEKAGEHEYRIRLQAKKAELAKLSEQLIYAGLGEEEREIDRQIAEAKELLGGK